MNEMNVTKRTQRAMTSIVILEDTITKKHLPLKVEVFGDHILVTPEGHGDKTSQDGYGSPIMVEFHGGKVNVFLWANINEEDPTHAVDMSGAKESNRIEETP